MMLSSMPPNLMRSNQNRPVEVVKNDQPVKCPTKKKMTMMCLLKRNSIPVTLMTLPIVTKVKVWRKNHNLYRRNLLPV